MATITKIKIIDDKKLRDRLDVLYDASSQSNMVKWSIKLANHVLEKYAPSYKNDDIILKGISANEDYQKGKISLNELRKIVFEIHKMAKMQENMLLSNMLRTIGHSIASGHMKEHAMVASDYAIKCINLAFLNDEEAIKEERIWQINELEKILNKH